LRRRLVLEDEIGEERFVILFEPTTRTVLDAESLSRSREVGSVGVFSRKLGGDILSFRSTGPKIGDVETQSACNLLGVATSGPLAGRRLSRVEHGIYFAFAWMAFRPDTELVRASENGRGRP